MYHAHSTPGDATFRRRGNPAVRTCAGVVMTAALGLVAGCSSSGGDTASFTPAPRATRIAPAVAADPLPPLSKFITQPDGSQVTTVSADYLFDSNSSELRREAVTALGQILPSIREHPGHIAVIGYSDGLGRTEDNLRLSQDRAKAVESWLATQGIPGSVLEVEGKGEEGAQDGVADASRRRVEIVLR
ncbi:flagellar motor protein MotB [Frankia sp. CcI156]|uniref:OmpA/MotB n=2 Tax=Frankiaceae TaxID=74712 RepID=Q2JG48_FRACC|nr:OmpA/MotB [Frankia casuarinae]ETA02274.1 outer membrane protein/peptidoglycan-associated (lipo)protein [Frankia sp. CcI6]KDA43308.1 outer membrane protein/peptidoglycan-associated (lipo)protein [Frankia sp. BMG5.23]KEZ36728.1 outer membrane protein/peptidoglycan-associated (lipo)protein [Frankia sp. CeD]KFB03534.1 outer membrane protein/peptidoglycan-associated (lipo)protein [Frankia sp. Allo2]OHV54774.1 flagellar motor protein MotB [Frankia sp. CgIS1]ONH26062.1 flagellar motor protein Mot